ncbi:hypothetical protein BDV97DRAFT_139564 [Delphinella strobiligena]|nr:hypothetical protein BDV97DRAFT_139564 [Delphinella strobiligena]
MSPAKVTLVLFFCVSRSTAHATNPRSPFSCFGPVLDFSLSHYVTIVGGRPVGYWGLSGEGGEGGRSHCDAPFVKLFIGISVLHDLARAAKRLSPSTPATSIEWAGVCEMWLWFSGDLRISCHGLLQCSTARRGRGGSAEIRAQKVTCSCIP